jgi:hypothetical protein
MEDCMRRIKFGHDHQTSQAFPIHGDFGNIAVFHGSGAGRRTGAICNADKLHNGQS